MTASEFWDEMLLPLSDAYESGDARPDAGIGPMFSEIFEVVRQCLAMKLAEGSLVVVDGKHLYRLTPEGYAKYRPRISSLRKFSASIVRN
jgi:hypothetical protein